MTESDRRMIRAEFPPPAAACESPAFDSPAFDRDVRTQYGALCWRHGAEGVEVLLITSRDTGRWVIPKGWPIDTLTPEASAAREAWEEAGVEGATDPHCLGLYGYDKGIGVERLPLPCRVAVYPLQVAALARRFPEHKQRRRKWFSPEKAARKVAEPELQALLAAFTPPVAAEM